MRLNSNQIKLLINVLLKLANIIDSFFLQLLKEKKPNDMASALIRDSDDGFSTANDSEFIVDPQPSIPPPALPPRSGARYNQLARQIEGPPTLPSRSGTGYNRLANQLSAPPAVALVPAPKRSFFNQQNANTATSLVLSTGVLASTIIALIAMAEVKKNPTSKLKGWATGINVILSTILLLVTANIGYGIFRAVQRNRTPK